MFITIADCTLRIVFTYTKLYHFQYIWFGCISQSIICIVTLEEMDTFKDSPWLFTHIPVSLFRILILWKHMSRWLISVFQITKMCCFLPLNHLCSDCVQPIESIIDLKTFIKGPVAQWKDGWPCEYKEHGFHCVRGQQCKSAQTQTKYPGFFVASCCQHTLVNKIPMCQLTKTP